jgi:heme exporter protein CcmD
MDHWPFVYAAYAVFFALILIDALGAARGRRRLLEDLRARAVREQRRGKP